MRFSRALGVVLSLSVLGCGGGNGCPNGFEPVMGMCVEAGARPDAGLAAPDALAAVEDAGAAEDAWLAPGADAGVELADAASMPDAAPTPDTGCPYPTLYVDADGDGYGDPSHAIAECVEARAGHVRDATDCDDACASCRPGGTETCNGADDDCDGAVDDGVTSSFYVDADGDGFGVGAAVTACAAPAGHSATAGDCDDACASCRPGGTETCNGADDDCDGAVDDGVMTTFYLDADGDTYGRDDVTVQACTQPSGHAVRGGDCNDASASVRPGQAEVCNDVDDDCDGARDEGLSVTTYRVDCDRDGFTPAAGESITACAMPTTAPTTCPTGVWAVPRPAADCHDGVADAFPGQTTSFVSRMSSPPTTGLPFDYDCNGVEQIRYSGFANCGALDGAGWRGTVVPACGVFATFDQCEWGGPIVRPQPCR